MEYKMYLGDEDGDQDEYTLEYSVNVSGKHRKATRESPEEFPEIEIEILTIQKNGGDVIKRDDHPDKKIVEDEFFNSNKNHVEACETAYSEHYLCRDEEKDLED